MTLVPKVLECMRAAGLQGVPVFVGGIIPEQDGVALRRMGVAEVFGPGASLEAVVNAVRAVAAKPE